jgi:RNA polymerase sigma-70 factor (TIGR02957 family)
MAENDAESRVTEFETYRSLLFGIAYRMLGSAAEAEDAVQDAYLRFAAAAASDEEPVHDVKAFLTTILTRLALDRLKSAQRRREEYIGPWLPEPVLTGDADGRIAREQAVEYALLTTLERLTPTERAVFLLHEVLDYDHNEIAEMLDMSAAASRQQLHRARERVSEKKRRFTPSIDEQRRLLAGFLTALRDGDVDSLRNLLTSDVVALSDGGGKATAARNPIVGVDAVSRFFLGIAKKATADVTVTIEEVNGAPAAVIRIAGVVFNVIAPQWDGERIVEIDSVLNPEKLVFLGRQLTG